MAPDVLVTGETLIDMLPERPGPLSRVGGFERRPGGAPANVAVGLARLGAPPLFWTRVGADPFGQYLKDVLGEEGLPERYVERDPEAKTTLAFVTHDEAGDRSFTFYREGTADTRLEPGRVGDATLADLEWVHAGGLALASEPARSATRDLIERAAGWGRTVSFDPNARPELWESEEAFAREVREVLPVVDVLKATVRELDALGFDGETAGKRARDALEYGPHTVLLTRGGEGALALARADAPWADGTERAVHPGFDVEVADTTGAGDAFLAGAIDALVRGEGLDGCLTFANAVAARATTASGAMTALPDRADAEALLSDQ